MNACLGTIANNLERSLNISLPEVIYGDGQQLFGPPPDYTDADNILFIYINFAVRSRDIEGYIAMLMDLPSMVTLKELLGTYIKRMTGQSRAAV